MSKTQEHEIVLYQIDDTNVCVSVYYNDETFWLTTKAMAELFGINTQGITKHLGNIYEEGELTREATCSKMEQVQIEGGRTVRRMVDFYNLDAIIAVGYDGSIPPEQMMEMANLSSEELIAYLKARNYYLEELVVAQKKTQSVLADILTSSKAKR